jgi:2-polyprenyl-3-methyl-5-hydroxy-6-metoxy-1,4-benzoquinol methylase
MGKVGIVALAASRVRNHYRVPMLRLKRKLSQWTSDVEGGFFDSYPRFYSTSHTAAKPNRLNKRHEALINSNQAIISGKSVLDIASHDGRWSLAAHKAGARYVLGIEAREHLVGSAQANMREYQVSEDQVGFALGDVFEVIDRLDPGSFETVFCFGFFYHTMHHMLLLSKIARLKPEHLILDSAIDVDPDIIVAVHDEIVTTESAGAVPDPGDSTRIVVGVPTKAALELMLSSSGFTGLSYYDWRHARIKRWDDLEDYHEGLRISLVATFKHAHPNSRCISSGTLAACTAADLVRRA